MEIGNFISDEGLDIYTDDVEQKRMLQKLHKAAMEGNWEAAKKIFDKDSNTKTAKLNSSYMTAMHVAARCGKSKFVVNMVSLLTPEELVIEDQQGRTALHYAASAASVEAAKAMVNKNHFLPQIEEFYNYTPLFYAARWRHPSKAKEMVEYLYHKTLGRVFTSDDTKAANLIVAITASGCHGVALRVLELHPALASVSNESGWSILQILASQPSTLHSENKPSKRKRSKCPWILKTASQTVQHGDHDASLRLVRFVCKELQKKRYSDAMDYFLNSDHLDPILHTATKNGVFELVKVCLNYFPELIWYSSPHDQKLLLHVAVEHRREDIFNHIINLIGENTETYAETKPEGDEENILHLAAKLAPTPQLHSVPGPAFQMQKELQWFKAVENLVYKDEKVAKNKKGQTPLEFFFEEHKDLIKDAKEWMKDTSNSCMIIAALVATVAFASMITVPGGNKGETGIPVLSHTKQFVVFSVSNALSMISSAIALLVFLSIQTSRYTEKDFLVSLPNNLLCGLLFLFVAVATMMIAFALAIGLALHTRVNWAYIPITLVACVPAIIFTRLQLPLLFQTLAVTSGPGISTTKRGPKLWCLNKLGYTSLRSRNLV